MNDFQIALKCYLECNTLSYRAMEKRTGVSKSLFVVILKSERIPLVPTLAALCNEIGFPLWKAIEAYGFDLGLSEKRGNPDGL